MPDINSNPVARAPGGVPPPPPGALGAPKPEITDQDLLKPSDIGGLRRRIYDNAFEAVKNLEPVANSRYRLRIDNPRWVDPETWSPSHQKKVFYQGGTLARRIQGDWVLEDAATNKEVSRKTATVASVPHLNDRGLFLLNGSHWHLGSQTRLDPGIYPRIQANGEVEAYVNPNGGRQHRISLDPESGVFHMEVGSSKIPLMPILKSLGVTNEQLHDAWGRDLVVKNAAKDDSSVVHKLVKKLYEDRTIPEGVHPSKLIADKLSAMGVDPYVLSKTIGTKHEKYGAIPIMDTTKRLLAISRGEAKPSERDHQAFQRILGPEHLFAEQIKNSKPILNPLLWRSTFKGNLDHMPSGALNRHIADTVTATGLGVNAQMTNPAEALDAAYRVSKMGKGGISSLDATPAESRNLHSSQFGFIDPVVTPESAKAGVDARFAAGSARDKDGHLYTKVFDQMGRPKWATARDLQGKTIGTGESLRSQSPLVEALRDGEMTMVPRSEVHYFSSPTESHFSPVANMIPFKSASPPHRAAMGARMLTQALPLEEAESPWVQSGTPDGGSFERLYGKHFGAIHAEGAGRVMAVGPDSIKVKYQDGQYKDIPLHIHELYDHAPGRKTHFTQTPMVQPGDMFKPGQILAKSNYTDKAGRVALGLNTRVAWLPARGGKAFEDAFAVSESYAKRMKSDHMSLHSVEEPGVKFGKRDFRSLFPTKYTPDQLKLMDDNGVIRPGSIVQPGQPLILGTRQSHAPRTTLVRSPKPIHQDVSEIWDHDYPGQVVDVVPTKNGHRVSVKSQVSMQDADKMCYSDDTEVLTSGGWKNIKQVSFDDEIASISRSGVIEYLRPSAIQKYQHNGDMYSLESTQVSLLVTMNHKLYINRRYAGKYRPGAYDLVEAQHLISKCFRMKRDGEWVGESPDYIVLPSVRVDAGQFGNGERIIPEQKIPVQTYMMLLGMYLSEGNSFCESGGNYGIDIHQTKPSNRATAKQALAEAGIKFVECPTKFRIYGLQLYLHFCQFGYCWEKYIPNEVFRYSKADLAVLDKWMMWGDGHVSKSGSRIYTTTSKRLADDFQRLALHLGWSANIDTKPACHGMIKGKEYDFRECYKVNVYRSKNQPEINYNYSKKSGRQEEKVVSYEGYVYCVTLPHNHVLYVRRNDKPVWCGNSGRHGNKGIVAIVPDHEMPIGEDGKPFEMLISPYTLASRQNASQIAELALGKIAAKTGKPYEIPDYTQEDLMKFANDELKAHGMKSTETVFDPVTNTKIPGVLTGNQFFMKLHHLVEEKLKQRDVGGYDSFGTPTKGGDEGAKRLGMADTFALLSHGAKAFLRGSKLARGQRNEKMWEAILSGYTPPSAGVPMQYRRLIEGLKAAGIHPVNENGKLRLKALTDEDVDRFAGDREIKNAKGIDWSRGGDPIKGGLFDKALHGEAGDRWSKLTLHTPMPNPAFEDPVRYTLGLTENQMRNVIAGKAGMAGGKYVEPEQDEPLPRGYQTGTQALHDSLKAIDLPKEIARAHEDIRGNKKTKRDLAIRKLKFLQGAVDQGLHPSQWIMSKVPILPPQFRPVSLLQGSNTELVSDPNSLYQDLFNANQNLKDLTGRVRDTSEERLALYDSLKAVSGLGDPINPKHKQKNIKGMLSMLLGDRAKWSVAQYKLLSSPVDLVGRSTVAPDANLDMDEIGIPEGMAFKVYGKFVTKRLVQSGMSPTQAGHALLDKSPEARRALMQEMNERPVSYHRAPVLHKYGHIGAWPKLVKGDTIKVSPFVIKGLGMDFDGNCVVGYTKITLEICWDQVYSSLARQDSLAAWERFKMRLVAEGQVVVEQDKSVVVVKIEDFPRIGEPVKDSNGADVYCVPDGVKVLSYNHDKCQVGFEPVTRFTVDKNHSCHVVTTARGRTVEVSSNESLVAFNAETGTIDKVKPEDCVGKMVPTIRKVNAFGDFGDRDLGWWYGCLVADGWLGDRTIGYAKNDKVKRDEFVRLAQKLFNADISYEYSFEKTEGKYADSTKVHINSATVVKQVFSVYANDNQELRGALRKKLPEPLLARGSKECLFGLLSGLLDGDAYVGWALSKDKPQFVANLYTSSLHLVDDILHLGCRLGIRCSVTTTPARGASHESYTVCLSTVDFKKVAKEMSTIGADTSKAIEEFVASDHGTRETRDSIPITTKQAGLLADACRKGHATLYSTCRASTKSGRIGRESAQRALEIAGKDPELAPLAVIVANEDVVWDIYETAVPTGNKDVFDLEVPTTKVFAVHNGLVIYDTANIHVPVYADEIKDIVEKMMPSRNLLSVKDFEPHYKPEREFHVGLWQATEGENPEGNRRERVFSDAAALRRAYQNGEVSVRDKVVVMNH